VIADAVLKAGPLLFCALSFLLAWKAGVLNIGAEGQFLAGALAATVAATRLPLPPAARLALALLAGAAAGALWAGIAAALLEKRGVLEVLSTILLNFVAAGVVSVAVHGFLQESTRTFPQSDPVPGAARLPAIPGTRVHVGILLAAALAVGLWVFLSRTNAGFRLRATGANRTAAEFAGIRVRRVRVAAFLVSGAIAGLGGAVELLGVTGRLFEYFSPGYGYLGLAVAVVAGLSPAGALASALAFGELAAIGNVLQRRYDISATAVLILEAGVLLSALSLPAVRRRLHPTAPEAET
jgi:ABC-type uncharacterized transport system permease subunit